MCTNRIEDRKKGLTYSCRRCDQCRRQACADLRGRLCCEHRTNVLKGRRGFLVTLTYGSDRRYYGDHRKNPRSQSFYWEDVQIWRKRLHRAGYPHRAYVIGECGDDRGRVHFHAVIWFTGWEHGPWLDRGFLGPTRQCKIAPNIVLSDPRGTDYRLLVSGALRNQDYKRYVHWLVEPAGFNRYAEVNRDWRDTSGGKPLWTHGWSTWEELGDVDQGDSAIGYATAYLFKNGRIGDTGIDGRGYFGRKFYGGTVRGKDEGPLGSEYFRTIRVPKLVKAGISPRDAIYKLDGIWKRDGTGLYEFFLPPGATRRIYLDAFVHAWRLHYGNDDWPPSDLVDNHIDDMERRQRRADGVADLTDAEFNDDFYRRRFAKGGGWAKLNRATAEQRERFRLVRSLQDAGFDIEVPTDLHKLFGPGHNQPGSESSAEVRRS